MIQQLIVNALRWIWRTPSVRNVIVQQGVKAISNEVTPAVRGALDTFRAAQRAREAETRRAKLNETVGKIAQMQVPELEKLLDFIQREEDPACRAEAIEAIRARLRTLKDIP